MRTRLVVLVAVTALVLSACGSRSSDDEADGSSTTTSRAASDGDTNSPCGTGDAEGATDKGVTDDKIRIATIQDIGGPAPGLFQGNLDSIRAFVAYCNSLGGVGGRELELVELDSQLLKYADSTRQACSEDVLAVVGTAAALDGNGTPELEACGIPDIPAFTAEPAHRGAQNMHQPIPNPPGVIQTGGQRYLAKEYPDAVKMAASLYSNRQVTVDTARERRDAYSEIGYEFVYEGSFGDLATEADLGPIVDQMKSKGVKYYNFVGAPSVSATIRKVLQTQGFEPIGDLDQSAYDVEGFLKPAGSAGNGTGITVTTVMFEEADTSAELQKELEWLEKTGAKVTPTALGVQGWSAGLLFATAAKAAGNDLTRERLLEELTQITEWDGNGIHAVANPGENKATECFVYVVVEDQEFTRVFPEERGTFSCDPDYVYTAGG